MPRNRVYNTLTTSSVTYWSGAGGTVATDATKTCFGANSMKVTATASGSSLYALTPGVGLAGCMAVTPGDVLRLTALIAHASGADSTYRLLALPYDSSGAALTSTYGPIVTCSAGAWTEVTNDYVVPAGAAWLRLAPLKAVVTGASTDAFNVARVGVLDGAETSWFNGGSAFSRWARAVDGSPSQQFPLGATVIRQNLVPNPGCAVDTWGHTVSPGTSGAAAISWATDASAPAGTGHTALATWTTAQTVANAYLTPNTTSGTSPAIQCVNNAVYSASVWVKPSKTGTWAASLQFYSPAGANLVGRPGSAVSCPAGQWTLLTVSAAAPAAGSWEVIPFASQTGGALLGVGDTVAPNGWLVEAVSAVGTYFDGDSLNASWVGTRSRSVSAGVVAQPRSNFPAIEVRAWPGESPAKQAIPTTEGVLLTDRVRAFDWSQGRQYELAEDEAGDGSLTLRADDGAFAAGAYGCTPITSCRVTAQWAGVQYSVQTGLIRTWPREDDTPSVSTTKATLTDLFEPYANRQMGPLLQEEVSYEAMPDLWFPMNEPESSTSIGNLVPGAPSAPLKNFKLGGIPLTLGTSSVFAGTSETVLGLANATGTTNRASQYQVVGPQVHSGYSLPFNGGPWAVGIFARCTAGRAVVFSALDADGTIMAALEVDATTPQVVGYMRLGARGQSVGAMNCGTGALGNGVFIHFGYDGTQMFVYVYGLNADGSLGVTANYATLAGVTGSSQWVAWGTSFTSGGIYYSSNADMQIAHGMVWTTAPPAVYSSPITAIAQAGLQAFSGYKSRDQVALISRYLGVTTMSGDLADGQPLGQMRDTAGASALDVMRAPTQDYLGRLFIDRNGMLSWQSVHHQMAVPGTKWTLGGLATEQPYTGSPGFDYDPTYVYNDVQVQRPDNRGVDQQSTSTKALSRATDAASAASYFARVLQVDSNVRDDADALAMEQYLLGAYAQHETRVRTVRFEPSANPSLWPFILGAERGDTVTLNHRAIGKDPLTMALSIQSISHTVNTDDGTWVTEMELAPWQRDWVLAAMHTTIQSSVAAGVTSVSLAPLPDKATNPAEASLGVGTTITLSPGTANAETMTILSVVSTPTAGAVNYTGITVTFTATTAHPHTAGDVACDPLPSGTTDPTTWDALSVLESTTRLSI